MTTLVIANINVNNSFLLNDIQGIAGLCGAGEYRDEITKVIDLSRYHAGIIVQSELDQMVGVLIRKGFTVSYE